MGSIFRIGLLSLLCVALLSGENLEQLLGEGKALLEQGQLELAEQRLIAAIEADPTMAESYYILGQVYLKQYDLDKTRENFRIAIDLDQRNQEYRDEFERVNTIASLMTDAKRILDGGNSYAAIAKYENVMNEFPEFSAMTLYHMGVASLREDDISEAARYFREATDEDSSYEKPSKALKGIADKIYNEANQSIRRGDYEGAIENYKKVLELDPDYLRAYFQMGFISTKLGEYDKAIGYYEKAVMVEPSFSKGWFALALAHQRNGDYEKALESLDRATSADPTYAKAYAQKGIIYLKQADYPSAEAAYNKAIQADPTYSKPYEDLGKIFVARQDYNEAVNVLTTATALNAKSSTAWYMLAQCYTALDQCKSGKEAALSALDVKPNLPPALYELGLAEVCLGNKTAALTAFEKARKDRTWRKAAEYEIDKIQHPERYQNR